MNRHPYGGGGGYDTSRRGGPPQSPGSDRSRFSRPPGRGGRGGGRGGGPSYYDNNDYDDGGYSHPSQGYNMNDTSHNDPYYYQGQNQHLGGGLTPSFSNTPAYGSYDQHDQGYGNTVYEDKSPSSRGQYNPANRGKRPVVRKERDDKIHDTLIEERIQRERPCRTLFIRNIKYETDSNEVRRRFEEHGEIKTFFDLISNRGMVFVTYYDLRAAERARERLQGSEISGRPIDVHYSLPRGDEQNQECDRDKNQGTLLVTLRNSVSGQPIDDTEVRRKFQQFGDVKTVKHVGDRPDQRYVEMYDIRACEEAHDRLRHQGLQDGVMDIVFAWDVPEMPLPPGPLPPNKRDGLRERTGYGDDDRPSHSSRGRGGGRGGRGGPRGGGRDNFRDRDPRDREMDDWERDRRDDWNRDRGRRYDETPGYKGGRYDRDSYSTHPDESRLEKAKKVQELLAALKQPPAASHHPPPQVPQASGPPPRMPPMPPTMPPTAAPSNNPYYSHPPPPPGSMQQPPPFMAPPNPYGYPPPPPPPSTAQSQHMSPPSQQQPPSTTTALPSGLPPNILALLQQAQAQQATSQLPHQQPQQQQAPPPLPYGLSQHMPVTSPPSQTTPAPGLPPAQYQQLLAFMSQQKRV